MEVQNIVELLDTRFRRMIRSTNDGDIISWEVGGETVTIDETDINRCARICLRNISDTVWLYASYIFRDDEIYNRHHYKFELSEIEDITLET